MNFNRFFNTKIFLFLTTFFFISGTKTELVNLNDFRKTIETAEFLYSKEEGGSVDFYEKLDVLDSLYAYRKKYREYLFYNNLPHDQEYKNINEIFFPLVKQVIRLLEIHLEDVYAYNPKSTFARIVSPVFYTGTFTLCTFGACKILKTFNVISEQNYYTTKNRVALAAPGITALWLAYNYKDKIHRTLKTGFGKRKIVYRKLVEKPEETRGDVVDIQIEDDQDVKIDDVKREEDVNLVNDLKKMPVQLPEGETDDTAVCTVEGKKETIEAMK